MTLGRQKELQKQAEAAEGIMVDRAPFIPKGQMANNAGSCTRTGHHWAATSDIYMFSIVFPFFSRQLDGTIILVGCSSHASEQPATQVTPPSCLCRTGSAWRHPLNKPSGQISSASAQEVPRKSQVFSGPELPKTPRAMGAVCAQAGLPGAEAGWLR